MTVWAFLDESGDPNLGVEKGATTHYAVGAVVVEEPDLDELRARSETLREKHDRLDLRRVGFLGSTTAEVVFAFPAQ